MGPDPENRVSDQGIGSPDRPVSSGLEVPGESFFPGPAKDLSAPLCKLFSFQTPRLLDLFR
jgi:hypothetical protein